jgi:hypothetical protein
MKTTLNALGAHQPGASLLPTQAARDVIAERERQITDECRTRAGDDEYRASELARAAAAYALHKDSDNPPDFWPWHEQWWKPKDARSNYVRAAALLIAEIERLDRVAQS